MNDIDENLLTYLSKQEVDGFYEAEAMIDRSKIKELEDKAKITLKDGEGISFARSLGDMISRKNIIYAGRFVSESPVTIREANGKTELRLLTADNISKRIQKISEKDRRKIGTIHLGTIQILIKSTYLKGIRSPIKMIVTDERIKTYEKVIGMIEGDLAYTTVKFDVSLQYGIPINSPGIYNSVSIIFDFVRKELMEQHDFPFTLSYAVSYALSNSAYSIDFKSRDLIHIDELFNTSTRYKCIPINQIEKSIRKFPPGKGTILEEIEDTEKSKIPELKQILQPKDDMAIIKKQLDQILTKI